MFDDHFTNQQQVQNIQMQRHEIARLRQVISEMEWHLNGLHQRAVFLGQNLKTQDQVQEYSNLLLTLNTTNAQLHQHYQILNEMMQLAQFDYGRQIPEQCRREIYHLYHAGRFTQTQLANQYQVSQSAVNKIVNGPTPEPIGGVNPNGIAS